MIRVVVGMLVVMMVMVMVMRGPRAQGYASVI